MGRRSNNYEIKREGDTKDLVIVSVYNNEEWSIGEETVNRIVEKYKEEYITLGGDFNARIGEEGGNEEDEWEFKRESKDKVINSMGRKLVNLVEELDGYSRIEGDREGEYTYVSNKGCSVIDYVIVNEKGYDIVNNFKIEGRADSDHMPLMVEVEERMKETGWRKEEEKKRRWKKEVTRHAGIKTRWSNIRKEQIWNGRR